MERIVKDFENIIKEENIKIPFLNISESSTDRYITWGVNSKLHVIANDYYTNPTADYLILIANRNLGIDENDWGIDILIRIPYPYESALERLNVSYENYKKIYLNEA